MINKKPELLSPAGSFMSAYYAFKAGADAVYLGLTKFSARKSAQNFNNNELLKLKKIAVDQNKKIYVTINTIIQENEIEELIYNLQFVNKLEVDGIIVQDFGVVEILRNYYPDIQIHASTQMAIHNEQGIEKAIELGIKRIILPRELPFKAIRAFKKKYKDMEFEVFIHGSLCYSYSGFCLSSGLLAGKSGNRGECTQPCRNLYSFNGEKGNYLSCKDLFLGKLIRRLMKIKIDSFKIEGRQKNPEYIYNVIKFYRYIIDSKGELKGPQYDRLLANCGFVYSREKSRGYIFRRKYDKIITDKYARNTGSPIGRVKKTAADSFSFITNSSIITNDVLLFFLNKSEDLPYKMPVRIMEVNGSKVPYVPKNELIKIFSDKIPEKGQVIFKAYSKELELSGITHRTFSSFRKKLSADITFLKKEKHMIRIDFIIDKEIYPAEYPIAFEKSGNHISLEERFQEIFSRPNEAFYEIKISKIKNQTSLRADEIFLSNIILKGISRVAYQFLEKIDKKIDYKKASLIMNSLKEKKIINFRNRINIDDPDLTGFIGRRENINLKNSRIPFYTGNRIDPGKIASIGKNYFIPLKPIVYKKNYYKKVTNFIKHNPDKNIFLGINNIHQIKFMESLERYDNAYSFIDFFFYAANRFTLNNYSVNRAKVVFGYYWIEGNFENYQKLKSKTDLRLFRIDSSFSAPVFLHDGSFAKESLKINFNKKRYRKNIKICDKDRMYGVYENNDFNYIFKE